MGEGKELFGYDDVLSEVEEAIVVGYVDTAG